VADSTPYSLSHLFTNLIDRRVSVVEASERDATKGRKGYATYDVVDRGTKILLQIDFDLLGSLGGALAGMPDAIIKQNLKATPVDETLRDAMHEILNIVSAVITTEGRAVLKNMELDEVKGKAMAASFKGTNPSIASRFQATIPNYTGGQMEVFLPIE
jgi:hypothetical protein